MRRAVVMLKLVFVLPALVLPRRLFLLCRAFGLPLVLALAAAVTALHNRPMSPMGVISAALWPIAVIGVLALLLT